MATWLVDLAGKAEALLENIDNAAKVSLADGRPQGLGPLHDGDAPRITDEGDWRAPHERMQPAPDALGTPHDDTGDPLVNGARHGMSLAAADGAGLPARSSAGSASTLELENTLLKSEVKALNAELASLNQRARLANAGSAEVRRVLEGLERRHAAAEAELRAARAADVEHRATISLLREQMVQFQELVRAKETKVAELEEEKRLLARDHALSTGTQFGALDAAHIELRQERDACAQLRSELARLQARAEADAAEARSSHAQLQRDLDDARQRLTEFTGQLRSSKAELTAVAREFADYKSRAAKVLQTKEKIIEDLRAGAAGAEGSAGAAQSADLVEACRERDQLRDELLEARGEIESLRLAVEEAERQLATDGDAAAAALREAEALVAEERRRANDAEVEVAALTQDLAQLRAVGARQRQTHEGHIRDRDAEIDRLRAQLAQRSTHGGDTRGLEDRLRALAESLIEKQTQIELLAAEKTSLQLQLEREVEKAASLAARFHQRATLPGDGAYVDVMVDDGRYAQAVPWVQGLQSRLRDLNRDPTVRQLARLLSVAVAVVAAIARPIGRFLRAHPWVIVVYVALYIVFTFVVMSRSAPVAAVSAPGQGAP